MLYGVMLPFGFIKIKAGISQGWWTWSIDWFSDNNGRCWSLCGDDGMDGGCSSACGVSSDKARRKVQILRNTRWEIKFNWIESWFYVCFGMQVKKITNIFVSNDDQLWLGTYLGNAISLFKSFFVPRQLFSVSISLLIEALLVRWWYANRLFLFWSRYHIGYIPMAALDMPWYFSHCCQVWIGVSSLLFNRANRRVFIPRHGNDQ